MVVYTGYVNHFILSRISSYRSLSKTENTKKVLQGILESFCLVQKLFLKEFVSKELKIQRKCVQEIFESYRLVEKN